MGCLFRTPVGALEAIRGCVTTALSLPPYSVPGQVLVGPTGVGNAYPCCETGLLSIEWLESSQYTHDGDPAASVSGRPCYDGVRGDFKVTVLRCVQSFDIQGNATNGGVVPVDIRNAAALAQMQESWYLYEQLLCCINSEPWEDCDVSLLKLENYRPEGMCWGYSIFLRADLVACC